MITMAIGLVVLVLVLRSRARRKDRRAGLDGEAPTFAVPARAGRLRSPSRDRL
jgi:hypothetical protein